MDQYKEHCNNIIARLKQALMMNSRISLREAEQQAWMLLEHVSGKKKITLLLESYILLLPEQQSTLNIFVKAIVQKSMPIQYLLGSVSFCNLTMLVKEPILIPRQETEEWVYWLIQEYKQAKNTHLTILDLCTGSGCIALSLASQFSQAHVIGVDIKPYCINLAKKNMQLLGINNASFIMSDLFQAIPNNMQFDLIVANPPYITIDEYKELQPEVRLWEDQIALVAQDHGLAVYKNIIEQAKKYLNHASILSAFNLPQLVFELGTQVDPICSIMHKHGLTKYTIHKDIYGTNRWISCLLN